MRMEKEPSSMKRMY
jgi:dynein heavy chain, axonemal